MTNGLTARKTKTKMTTKKFTISFAEYVFRKYLSDIKENRSKFIEEMFVRGIEAECGEYEDYKSKYINSIKEIRKKEVEINQLKLELGRAKVFVETKEQKEKKRQEEQIKDAVLRGLRNDDSWKG